MSTRPYILQHGRIGNEGTAGVTAGVYSRLHTISFTPAIQFEGRDGFRPVGNRYNTVVPPGKEWTTVDFEGPVTYNELQFILASMYGGGSVSTAALGGGTYRWVFAASGTAIVTPQTLTLEQGDDVRNHRVANLVANSLSMTWNRDGLDMTGSMLGKLFSDNPGFTVAPAALTSGSIVPALPGSASVFMSSHVAGIGAGTARLGRVLDASLSISDFHGVLFPLDATKTSWDVTVNTAPTIDLSMTLMADGTALALLTAARNAGRRFFQLDVGGDNAGSANYSLQFEGAFEVMSFDAFQESQGVYSIPVTLTNVFDDTWGTAHLWRLVNKAGTLNSWGA